MDQNELRELAERLGGSWFLMLAVFLIAVLALALATAVYYEPTTPAPVKTGHERKARH